MKTCALHCAVLLIAMGCLARAQEPAVSEAASYDSYKAIYEKNIFSRNRSTPPSLQNGGEVRREKVVLSLYVLRGVAVETKKRLAFIEDEISGQWKRLTVGEPLLNGTIVEILPDHVLFVEGNQSRAVKIGQEFDRIESEVERRIDEAEGRADPNTPAPPLVSPTVKPPASSQDADAVLKQMLERRRREMGNQ